MDLFNYRETMNKSNRHNPSRTGHATRTGISFIKKLDVQHSKPLQTLTMRDTILPVAIASSLFFSWGFAYGLLDIMNYHVRIEMELSRETVATLAAGYYSAYIPGPLLAGMMVRSCGYRLAFVTGLLVFGLGSLFISLGAQACNYPGMAAGMFVIGLGVATLERSANAYVVNIGPREQGTLRILLAQAMAGVGTVVAPFVANKFLFDDSNAAPESPSPEISGIITSPGIAATLGPIGRAVLFERCHNLGTVITLYRSLGFIVLGLAAGAAVVFFRTWWVPEARQSERSNNNKTGCGWKLWRHPLVSMTYSRLWWAVIANFFNIGCQVGFAQFFIEHMITNARVTREVANHYLSIAQALFVVGRFAAAAAVALPRIFKPRLVLFVFIMGAVIFTGGCAFAKGHVAVPPVAMMVMFFEAPSFPMIFESSDVGLGEWSSSGETIMIVSIAGGALQPPLLGKLNNAVGVSKAWLLTAGCFTVVWSYCWATNLIPSFRKSLDQEQCHGSSGAVSHIETQTADEESGEAADDKGHTSKDPSEAELSHPGSAHLETQHQA